MRKILLLALVVFTSFALIACEEITDDFNKGQKPAIELKHEGDLIQIYEENEKLEAVEFEVIFKQFTENEIDLTKITINWYIRDQIIEAYENQTKITQTVNSPGNISVRVEVLFSFEGINQKLEADALIEVHRTQTVILVTNDVNETSHRISVTLGQNNEVEFTGIITGNVNISVFNWVIQKQESGEPFLVGEPILVDNLVINGNTATAKLNYRFVEPGNYIITLQTGEGTSQDANRYISNSTHITVGYGAFDLTTQDEKVMTLTNGFTNSKLEVSPLDTTLVGNGTYEWYLDGVKLSHTGLEYIHNQNEVGGFLYQVVFRPDDNNISPIKTEPLLIINGVEVANENEMLLELENKTKALILTNDIHYTSAGASLILNYPVTIYGNGHRLESNEIEVFISVTADNVYLANLEIVRANRYNLMFTSTKDGYLEDISFDELGGGSNPTDFLSGDFGSALYINQSKVVVNNIEFISGGLVGIRIDNETHNESNNAVLELFGNFIYNSEDPLLLPIGSGKSTRDGVEVIATGFDYFALPAGNITIRRWDNQGDPVTWQLFPPQKTNYELGGFLDVFGIGINVDIGFLGMEISGESGLDFVKMYIKVFNQYGKLEITDMDDDVKSTYFIVGETSNQVYGLDLLVYSETKELNIANQVRPTLPDEAGQYKVKIYIGEEFYLGHIIIDIA